MATTKTAARKAPTKTVKTAARKPAAKKAPTKINRETASYKAGNACRSAGRATWGFLGGFIDGVMGK